MFGNSSAGGITNNGSIAAGSGGLFVAFVPSFTGHIVNSGTISAANGTDITFHSAPTYLGGIVNKGKLVAPLGRGIYVNSVALFGSGSSGGITNSGVVSAQTGIAITHSTVAGAIVDSGTVKAASHGILVDDTSEILSTGTAVAIAGPTFTGGISNFGVISGSVGIKITSRAFPKFESYGMSETAAFRGWKAQNAIERFHRNRSSSRLLKNGHLR